MDKQQFHEKRLFTMKELMEYTGLGESKAREWAREIGAARKIGRRTVFSRRELTEWVESRTRRPEEAKAEATRLIAQSAGSAKRKACAV